jgi:hypothetical protein
VETWTAPLRPDDPDRANGVALLYSGGCDSTLAASRLAQHFPKVHLVTYLRFGFMQTDNPDVHAERMRRRWPTVEFTAHKIPYERFYAEIEGHEKLRSLWKHGTMTSVPCGSCKISMHFRNAMFCVEHDIHFAADGAVYGNEQFAEQNPNVMMQPLRDFYASFGVTMLHPVFERGLDTEAELFKLGITDSPHVKRTRADKQVICSQHILFAMFMRKYLNNHTFEEYEAETRDYLMGKLRHATELMNAHVKDPKGSAIAKMAAKDGDGR